MDEGLIQLGGWLILGTDAVQAVHVLIAPPLTAFSGYLLSLSCCIKSVLPSCVSWHCPSVKLNNHMSAAR